MSPNVALTDSNEKSFPRSRGDEPLYLSYAAGWPMFSPLTRG